MMAERELVGPRFLGVNLDSDSDLERLLVMKNDAEAGALGLKVEAGVWWVSSTEKSHLLRVHRRILHRKH
jgi:hypothetical protein